MSNFSQSILFVCMGNICRSPMVEGVFKSQLQRSSLATQIHVDSAGTGSWHEGNPPDPRAIETMEYYHIDITDQRSRPMNKSDYSRFDLVLAMDYDNSDLLISRAPIEMQHKVHLFMDYATGRDWPIPDPYYGKGDGFDKVYQMLVEGCSGLIEKLEAQRS